MSRPLKCLDCPESEVYSSENELEAHIAADHIKMLPYGCGKCKYGKFPTESALFNHHSEVHGNISNITSVFHGSRELPAQRKELMKKLEKCIEASNSTETGDPPPKLEITIDETPCDPVKCLDCTESEEYHSTEKLEAHIADVHLKSFPYKCEICKHAMFPTEYMVRCHYQEDHKRSGEFNLIMRCSPEIISERKELARRLEMFLASGLKDSEASRAVSAGAAPQRVESPLIISPVKRIEQESKNRKLIDLPVEPPLADSPIPEVIDLEHEAPRSSSVISSVGASPVNPARTSGLKPQASDAAAPVPTRRTSAASTKASAVPRSEIQASGPSTPVPSSKTQTAFGRLVSSSSTIQRSTPQASGTSILVPTRRTSTASARQLPSTSEGPRSVPQTSGASTPGSDNRAPRGSVRQLPSSSAVPRFDPQTSGPSTPVPTKKTSTTVDPSPILSPVGSDTRRKSSRVSKKKVFADFVAEPETAPTSPAAKPGAAQQRPSKRRGLELSSDIDERVKRILLEANPTRSINAPGPSTTTRTRTISEPDIDMTAKNLSEIPRHPNLDLVKSEYPSPIKQVKVENSAGPSSSFRTTLAAGWPFPYPLKVEEPEDTHDNLQDQDYQEDPDVDPEEEEQEESEEEPENSEDDDEEDFVLVKKKTRCYTCTVCSVTVKSSGSRLTHACTHGNFVLYECRMCDQKFSGYNINDVKRHIQHKHKVMDEKVIQKNINDFREKSRDKIMKLKDVCFPLKE